MSGSATADDRVCGMGVATGLARRVRELTDQAQSVARARWYLRAATELGPRVRLKGRPYVKNTGEMIIHDRVQLVSTVARMELVASGGRLEIGSRTFINYGTSICALESIIIGERCHIGTHVAIIDNDFHRLEPERRLERPASRPVRIEDGVWLAGRVIVLPGVTIGHGSAIGAGSVVTHDVPPRVLAAGSPAKVIREP
jgi:maltose O-acetyltransferase